MYDSASKLYTESGLPNFWSKLLSIGKGTSLWRTNNKLPLLSLLSFYHMRESSDVRDRIYGLLGLTRQWGISEVIVPRYEININRLYEAVAFRSIAVTNTLFRIEL